MHAYAKLTVPASLIIVKRKIKMCGKKRQQSHEMKPSSWCDFLWHEHFNMVAQILLLLFPLLLASLWSACWMIILMFCRVKFRSCRWVLYDTDDDFLVVIIFELHWKRKLLEIGVGLMLNKIIKNWETLTVFWNSN